MVDTLFTPQWLKDQRALLNMTQHQLGDALGVHTQTVSSWECGAFTPQAWPMLKLAIEALIGKQSGVL